MTRSCQGMPKISRTLFGNGKDHIARVHSLEDTSKERFMKSPRRRTSIHTSMILARMTYSSSSGISTLRLGGNASPRRRYTTFQRETHLIPSHELKTSSQSNNKSFHCQYFPLSAETASKECYDIIIIGTGIGGGVIAGDMFDTNVKMGKHAKSILVIEKGDLVFHSHCLNASRPFGLSKDRGQANDTFFASFKDDFKFTNEPEWKGGPMYCLGGRSAAWGLFAPRIHENTLSHHFPSNVRKALIDDWYDEAEALMKLSQPETKLIHQQLIDRLNMESYEAEKSLCARWEWGRIASEFHDHRNFDFAEGAYSSIDKLLEIAMSKPLGPNKKEQEHLNFKIVLNTEVTKLLWKEDDPKVVDGVQVKTTNGTTPIAIKLKEGGRVIVSAGSVNSAVILFNSGVDLHSNRMRGGTVTDHDIFSHASSFRYKNPGDRERVGAMKLQTNITLDEVGGVALANISIDASSFLPRDNLPDPNLPQMFMVYILKAHLAKGNRIEVKDGKPLLTMNRAEWSYKTDESKVYAALKKLTKACKSAMEKTLGIKFIPNSPLNPYFRKLQLGGVAHELGTIPMPTGDNTDEWSVDEDLKLRDKEGVYVCDLSIFPISPEANPTITLAALALRLSRTLHQRVQVKPTDEDSVYVVNESGKSIKVWLSNRSTTDLKWDVKQLETGEYFSEKRKKDVAETVFVFKADPSFTPKDGEAERFLNEPELILAHPGAITIVN